LHYNSFSLSSAPSTGFLWTRSALELAFLLWDFYLAGFLGNIFKDLSTFDSSSTLPQLQLQLPQLVLEDALVTSC
jgi:hypothetical protein